MVECSFADPSREAQWSEYYDGPKIDQVLAVPGFKTSQRLKAIDGGRCPYLAMHTVTSLAILEGQSYKGGGGGSFGPWQSLITDWRRSFYAGLDEAPDLQVGSHIAVTDLTEAQVAALGLPFVWLKGAGLQATPQRGLAQLSAQQSAQLQAKPYAGVRVYTPTMKRRLEPPNKAQQ